MALSPDIDTVMDDNKCGCKGIRRCLLCEPSIPTNNTENRHISSGDTGGDLTLTVTVTPPSIKEVWSYCPHCQRAWSNTSLDRYESPQSCETHSGKSFPFRGINIFENFVTLEEERNIVSDVDKIKWKNSQSGRRKQDFGPKVNFKRQKLNYNNFTGLPPFSKVLVKRMNATLCLQNFHPIEQCHLEYVPERGSAIDPHFDDWWIWGEHLVTINLLSNSFLLFNYHQQSEFEKDDLSQSVDVSVPMPSRSMLVVYSDARFKWMHSIPRNAITDRRIAITYRELSEQFLDGGDSGIGKAVMEIAQTYQGTVVM